MIKTILAASGIQHRGTRWTRPPAGTYAVYFDNVERDAADRVNVPGVLPAVVTHNVMVELYEDAPDDIAETALEAAMNAQGLSWTKQDRYWLQDVQRYQVIYEFTYTAKA